MSYQCKQHSLYSPGMQGLSPCSSGHTPGLEGKPMASSSLHGIVQACRSSPEICSTYQRGECVWRRWLEGMTRSGTCRSAQASPCSWWRIPAGKFLFIPTCIAQGEHPAPRRCASKNCQVKHLLSLIPQDTVGVKGIAQISPEQFAWHWESLGMTWWGFVRLGSGGTLGTLG